MKLNLKRWLIAGCLVLLMLSGTGAWYVYEVIPIGSMSNQVYQETKSPDGNFVATLAYRDGLTFGYYFVCLHSSEGWHSLGADDPVPKDEVAEVAEEGLDSIAWQGNHILVVNYVKSKPGKDNYLAANFVLKHQVWKDVHITYHGE